MRAGQATAPTAMPHRGGRNDMLAQEAADTVSPTAAEAVDTAAVVDGAVGARRRSGARNASVLL
jgi:hypothetical protein